MERVVKNRYKARQLREVQKGEKWSDSFSVYEFFMQDPDMRLMRQQFTADFSLRFDMAFRNYEAGQWMVARDMLESTRFLLKNHRTGQPVEDGPTAALLTF